MNTWVVYAGIDKAEKIKCNTIANILKVPFVFDNISYYFANSERPNPVYIITILKPMLKFCDWRNVFYDIIKNSKLVINLRDDYTYVGDIDKRYFQICKKIVVWTSITDLVNNDDTFFLDNNKLFSNPVLRSNVAETKYRGVFYYGNLRDDRKNKFNLYFNVDDYKVYIACRKHDILKWKSFVKNATYFLYTNLSSINTFESSIYLEDQWMKKHDCCISRRFYECINAKISIFFDGDTISNFQKNKIKISDEWVVNDSKDVKRLLKYSDKIKIDQIKYFSKFDWFSEISTELEKLLKLMEV